MFTIPFEKIVGFKVELLIKQQMQGQICDWVQNSQSVF